MSDHSAPDRVVQVSAERLAGWIDRFAERHGVVRFDAHEGQSD